MSGDARNDGTEDEEPRKDYKDYSAGLPDHHDPTSGLAGAPPARSALTLRLVLAGFGLVVSVTFAVLLASAGAPAAIVVVLSVLAVVAAVDLLVVARRKRRGEPG